MREIFIKGDFLKLRLMDVTNAKKKVLDFLKDKEWRTPTFLSRELSIHYYLIKYILADLEREEVIEKLTFPNGFVYYRIK